MKIPDCTAGAPRLISWNVTLRCPLRCSHCYVNAGEKEPADVLSTDEALGAIDQIRQCGTPLVVLSGGEPLLREDLCTIARYGTDRGLRMAVGTSGFYLDRDRAVLLKRAGIVAIAISIDSAVPEFHDTFRGVPGVWERAVRAIRNCGDVGIPVQINMAVMKPDGSDVEGVIGLGTSLGVRNYQLFFPVATGREEGGSLYDRDGYERLIRTILLHYNHTGLNVRPTCAPQFMRIADEAGIRNPAWSRGCLAGISYCRIYANGDVTPCPYLPVSTGNLRTTAFGEIWNHSALFRALRDPMMLTGKCGRCGYKTVCGGCRARAYRGADAFSHSWCDGLERPGAVIGEICAGDPWCTYEPDGAA